MLETLCRLCAAKKPLLIRIFDNAGLEKSLPVKIQLNLGITVSILRICDSVSSCWSHAFVTFAFQQVSRDDVLPLSICYLCLEKLETFNNFVELCQASQVRLNELHAECVSTISLFTIYSTSNRKLRIWTPFLQEDIANMDLKPSSGEENVVEVVFIDSDMYETKCTVPSSSLNTMGSATTLKVRDYLFFNRILLLLIILVFYHISHRMCNLGI